MSGYDHASRFRALPSVAGLARHPQLQAAGIPDGWLTALIREELAETRRQVAAGEVAPSHEALAVAVLARAARLQGGVSPVINATGILLHTNLGRAPLSTAARRAMDLATRGYSNLEFDLDSGGRGSRHRHVEELLQRVTGAEAALAVNNNAAALLLALGALCSGREAVISRGELVEIGGGVRIPDVLRQSGARMIETGTTNRTYVNDYTDATSPDTAAYLRVHSSNFRITGFTARPDLAELVEAAHHRGLLLIDDLGSGALFDTTVYGLDREPMVQDSVAAGADLVLFSGDKLLGGPQAGILAGRAVLIAQLRRHPLARALRLDKGSLAALHATLLHYARGEAQREVPVWRMIATPLDELESRAQRWAAALAPAAASLVAARSMVGGGSLPGESLPTVALRLETYPADGLARRLRTGHPAVAGRIERDGLLLDPRTVAPEDDGAMLMAVRAALAGSEMLR